jgi:hypothetical protein
MWYSGYIDKTGKKILVGDTLENGSGRRYVVKFEAFLGITLYNPDYMTFEKLSRKNSTQLAVAPRS